MSISRTIPAHIQALADSFTASAKARFGDDLMRMEDAPAPAPAPQTPPAPAPAPAQPAPGTPAPPAPVPPAGAVATDPASGAGGDDISSLPTWAQGLIGDLRKENGSARTNAKQAAAEEAKAEVAEIVGKALGLNKDDAGAPTTDDLTKTIAERDAQVKQTATDNLVLRHGAALGANVDRLLDSRSFVTSLADIDPSAADAAETVKTRITAALAADVSLKQAQAVSHGGSSMPGSGQATTGEQVHLSPTSRMASAYGASSA